VQGEREPAPLLLVEAQEAPRALDVVSTKTRAGLFAAPPPREGVE